MIIIPKYLYKYRVWENKRHEAIITDNEIYFASSAQFNDPFDCKIPMRFDRLTRTERLKYILEFGRASFPNLDEEELWKVSKRLADNPTHQGKNLLNDASKAQNKVIENNFGIFSLTSDPKNILMWSHYAESHTGFCVCFDIVNLLQFFQQKEVTTNALIELHKVRYKNEYPSLLPSDDNKGKNLLQIMLTKSQLWSYENEYRIIIGGATRITVTIPSEFINCVILGCKISDSSRNEILHILKTKKNRVTLCQAKMNELDFRLSLEEIDY